ncbi:MAG: excinuclease ABC subunit UvrA [Ardenticatenaceae bacterium]|nr:excinuclease ABC subunit UvrA [Ardenticatenaceae bacterium]
MTDQIIVRGARLHNLKNITVSIPKYKLVVLTGLSGSGKSTLGFDILHMEGQRQYLESLGLATFGVAKPAVDSIVGLSPTISLDQHLTNNSPRSTVGTSTEVYTYLRILFARVGHRPCPNCGQDVPPAFDPANADWEETDGPAESADAIPQETFPCPHCGMPIPEINMAHFSFNKPEGACPSCTGLGVVQEVNIPLLIDEAKSIRAGAVLSWDDFYINHYGGTMLAAAAHYGFPLDLDQPVQDYPPAQRELLLYGVESPRFRRHFPTVEPPARVKDGRFEGIATALLRRYSDRIQDADYRDKMSEYLVTQPCPDCDGTRLRPESRTVTVAGQPIVPLTRLPLIDLGDWLRTLPATFSTDEMIIAGPILEDLNERIARLVQVGAGYLTLERTSPTLSAGEAQRLRLAALLGSGLSGLLYIFDEPTIGTHQRDTRRLIAVLRRLRDLGNTVLVIEHDLEMVAAADYVIDIGPGAGKHGGEVVAAGSPAEIMQQAGSLTADYLAGRISIPVPQKRRVGGETAVTIHNARQNNLKNVTVRFPLGLFVAVTGVSGSGKSSLLFDILDPAIRQRLTQASDAPGAHDRIEGIEHLDKIVTIDQAHLRRMPRSNAATYTDTFTPIRKTFADTPEAQKQGYTARHFSFNVPGGRCERCQGAGVLTVNMQFMPDVEVRCPVCHGRRFNRQTLAIKYRDHDISQVLDMTVEEALALFVDVPAARSRLQVLADVGLGYLQLGQPATTLSGGEAQRVKLAKELGRRVSGHTLYLLDEPTTGLHLADTARLLGVLHRLVDAGNTVIVVEHNLELVKTADWVIDMGPEGGVAGGQVLAEGTPEQVAQVAESYTGQYLKEIL